MSQSIVGDNAVGTNAAYLNPQYVTFDNSFQNLYISEYGRGAIRAVNIATGVATTVAGAPMTNPIVNTQALVDGFGLAARFNDPGDLAFTASGLLVIGDGGGGNHRIRIMNQSGYVQTVAGGGAGSGTTAVVDGVGSAASF